MQLAGLALDQPKVGLELTRCARMNEFQENLADTAARTLSERHMEAVRQQGGMFVEAVRVTRMPMLVTDAALPGNPIIFANRAFIDLSGYAEGELLGQDPHFMNGAETELRSALGLVS